jgi:hypothetical protein
MSEAIKKFNYDVIGLSEVKRKNECLTDHGHFLFYHNGNDKVKGLVGFIIHQRWRQNIISIESSYNRIATLELKIKQKKFIFIQVYAPTSSSTDEIIDEFYKNLEETVNKYSKLSNVFLLGDFNAKIGKALINDDDVMGKFGFGVRNERGEILLEFARDKKFFFSSSNFKKNEKRRPTWTLGKASNEIDYILVKKEHKKSMKNIDVINRFDYDSDHKPVRLIIMIHRLHKNHNQARKSVIVTQDQNKIDAFNEKITSLEDISNYSNLVSAIQESSLIFNVTSSNDKIIRDETKAEIEKRELMRKLRRDSETAEMKFRFQRKKVNNLINSDVRKFELNKLEAAIDRRRGWKKAKKSVIEGKNRILKIKNESGIILTDQDAILNEFVNYYEKLYTSTLPGDERLTKIPDLSEDSSEIDEISMNELKAALNSIKNDRAPGSDFITAEMLKICNDEVLEKFRSQFNKILQTEVVPVEWLESTIVVVHKKGDKTNISNYRPISKTSHIYKWFMKILQSRMKSKIDEFQSQAQAAFRKGFSITDHLFTINQVIEKCNEFNIEAHIGLMDYSKAFDSLEHWHLYQSLVDADVEKKYIRIVKNIYDNVTAKIKLHEVSRAFKIERGIRQGCVCSTDFFITSLEKIYRTIDISQHGIDVNSSKLVDLRFADDRAVIAKSAKDLVEGVQKISEGSKVAGLIENYDKMKVITNSSAQSYHVEDVDIQISDHAKYLGQIISFNNREIEIDERIAAGWRAFHANKKYLCGSLPMYHKKEIFEKNILSVLTFGCQDWALSNAQKEKLAVTQHNMERKVLHVRKIDKVKLSKIRSLTKWRDVNDFSSQLKFKWAGHVARMNDARLPKKMLNWVPVGQRSRGRPKPRWEDEIKNRASFFWRKKAQNRSKWAQMTLLN